MKRIVVLFLVFVVLVGCAEKRHLRKRKKAQEKILEISLDFPELFDYDTTFVPVETIINIPLETYIYDTVVRNIRDSIVIETERIKTVLKPLVDTRNEVIEWRVKTKIKADTIEYIYLDTIVEIKTEIETKTVTKKVIPWWIWLIFGLLGGLVFVFGRKYLNNA